MCADIAQSLHCAAKLRLSGRFKAARSWRKPKNGSIAQFRSLKDISRPATFLYETLSLLARDGRDCCG
jgi:hypothetical protein